MKYPFIEYCYNWLSNIEVKGNLLIIFIITARGKEGGKRGEEGEEGEEGERGEEGGRGGEGSGKIGYSSN